MHHNDNIDIYQLWWLVTVEKKESGNTLFEGVYVRETLACHIMT